MRAQTESCWNLQGLKTDFFILFGQTHKIMLENIRQGVVIDIDKR